MSTPQSGSNHYECSHEGLISLDTALASYAQVKKLPVVELDLLAAHQHILATDVLSSIALPLFNQSAVDGYALRQADIDAGIRDFELIGEIRAGIEQQFELRQGQALRIFTGGKLSASSDTVARQEIVNRHGNQITLQQTIHLGTDIRYKGEELQPHTLLATQGQRLTTGLIAALSMAGIHHVEVYCQPRISVLITGDEVSSELTNDAQVFDANGPLILSWLKEQGYQDIQLQHVIDEETSLKTALEQALNQFDLVITTGGVSVGDYDLIRPVSMRLGAEQVFWQVAQKPGKPLYFATYHKVQHQSYLIGLPGNPAAVALGLYVHVQTLLNELQGKTHVLPHWHYGKLANGIKPDSREQILRMRAESNAQGELVLYPLTKQQSHMLSNMNQANALVRVPAGQVCEAGEVLRFLWI